MKKIFLDDFQIHDNLADIGCFVSPGVQGLESPDVRLSSFVRPNVDGAVVPSQLWGGRLLTLDGVVYANTATAYRKKRMALEGATGIQKDFSGNLRAITLRLETMDGLSLQVEVFTRKLVFVDNYTTHGRFRLEFFAPSFSLLSQRLSNQDIFIFFGGGMAIPLAIPTSMNVAGSTLIKLNNNGNMESFPIFTFFGPLTNPVFSNLTTNKSFSLAYTLTSASQNITIDTNKKTATFRPTQDGNPVNIRQHFSGDFVTLAPNGNQVKLSNVNYNAQAFCRVSWRDSYSGV